MFTPFYLHPLFNSKECQKYRDRWTDTQTNSKNTCYDKIIKMIEGGAGKDFLNYDFYRGNLPTLEDDLDLKGIELWKLEIDFKDCGDCFKGIDFKYAQMWHLHFKNAVFYSCSFGFAQLYNCTFENCAFAFAGFMGAKLDKCNFIECEFVEHSSFENAMILGSTFNKCFLGKTTPFRECYFDDLVVFKNAVWHSYHFKEKYPMLSESKASLYSSFQAAYQASGAEELAMDYYYQARKSYTRNNQKELKKLIGFVNELITGYGVRPARPIVAMVVLNSIGVVGFSCFMPVKESIIFTAGAFFTFGAMAQNLDSFGIFGRIIYVGFSFSGIILSGLFVTTLANLWFRSNVPNQTVDTEK